MSQLEELLETIPLFHGVETDHLAAIASIMETRTCPPDEDLVRVGEAGGSLMVVLSGQVRILYPGQNSRFEMTRLGPGEHLGEMSLLNGQPRSATARAAGEVEVAVLHGDAFRKLALKTPGLAVHMLSTLSVRMRGADEHISILSDMAMRDALTGLLNRRAFQDRMKQELDRARRYKGEFSLLLFDLDGFKAVNDTLGHDVGDAVLRWVGRILAEHTRASDSPFRIGGEEFAVICPATGPDSATIAASRLVETLGNTPSPVEDLAVTMSGGYACCPTHGSDYSSLYRTADQALLAAKDQGGNRVVEPAGAGVE